MFHSPESDPPHKIMPYDLITQSSWYSHFTTATMVNLNFFVPQLYQIRRGMSGGPALKYFYMIAMACLFIDFDLLYCSFCQNFGFVKQKKLYQGRQFFFSR